MPKHKKKRLYPAKKEQAALEYLVTYGWAILVVLVAIAGLAYFGVFSSDKFVPSRCILPPGISCMDFKVENDASTGNGKITLRVQNNLGEDIAINNVAAADCGTLTTSTPLLNGEATTLYVDCANPISTSKYNEQINITYASMFSGITHTLKGDLTSPVSGEAQQITPPPDTTPPTVTITAPTSNQVFPSGTTQATLSATTNENANCRYSTIAGQLFSSMTPFTTTGTTSHSYPVTGLADGNSYTRYIKCQDTSPNLNTNTNDYTVSFSVALPGDTIPPAVSITAPTQNQVFASGTTQATLTATTNEAATCRWSTTDQAYSSMPSANTMSGNGTTSHTTTLTGLADGNSYTRYVRCQDTAGNPTTASQSISFSVAASSGPPPSVLIIAYNFDEGSGTTTADRSGNGNTGTLTNGPLWTAGKYSNGLQFDGINDYVDTGVTTSFNTITYSAWINTTGGSPGLQRIVARTGTELY